MTNDRAVRSAPVRAAVCSASVRAASGDAIVRRDFLSLAGSLSLFIAAGNAPLLAASAKVKGNAPLLGAQAGGAAGAPLPYAVKDYWGVVLAYKPPTGAPGKLPRYVYGIHAWSATSRGASLARAASSARPQQAGKAGRPVPTRNPRAGAAGQSSLVIQRETADGGVRHAIQHTLAAPTSSVTNVTTRCDDLRQGTVSWQYRNVIANPCGVPGPTLTIEESGTLSDKTIEIDRGAYRESLPRENPVFTLWQLIDTAPDLVSKQSPLMIDLLDDGVILRRGITLAYDGAIDVPVAGGRTLQLDSYVLYGPGLPPAHMIYDAGKTPHFITCFMRIYALEGVA